MNTKERNAEVQNLNKVPLNDLTNQYKSDYYSNREKDRSFAFTCLMWLCSMLLIASMIYGAYTLICGGLK